MLTIVAQKSTQALTAANARPGPFWSARAAHHNPRGHLPFRTPWGVPILHFLSLTSTPMPGNLEWSVVAQSPFGMVTLTISPSFNSLVVHLCVVIG